MNQREAHLTDLAERSQQRYINESDSQREADLRDLNKDVPMNRESRITDLSERSQQRCASESNYQRETDLRERSQEQRANKLKDNHVS